MPKKIPKCPKHPKYRAIRAPVAVCRECEDQYWATYTQDVQICGKILKLVKKMDLASISHRPEEDNDIEMLVILETQRRNLYK